LCDSAQKYIRVPLNTKSDEPPMRSNEEIRKMMGSLEKDHATEGRSLRNIAGMAARSASDWVLGETDSPITY